jgi:hypothetical protein
VLSPTRNHGSLLSLFVSDLVLHTCNLQGILSTFLTDLARAEKRGLSHEMLDIVAMPDIVASEPSSVGLADALRSDPQVAGVAGADNSCRYSQSTLKVGFNSKYTRAR